MRFPRPTLQPPAPFVTGRWEMGIMRGFVAVLTWLTFPVLFPPRTQEFPTGLGRFIDFSFLNEPTILATMNWALVIAGILFTFGRFVPLALGYMTAAMVAYGCLRNAQGAISHDTQVLALALLAGWLTDLYLRWRPTKTANLSAWTLFAMQQGVAATYLVTGLTKILAKGSWLADATNYPVQIVKTSRMHYYSDLIGDVPGKHEGFWGTIADIGLPLRDLLIEHPWLSIPTLGFGLLIELIFCIALLGRRPALILGLAAAGFHVGVYALMGLKFDTNIWIVLILFANAPFWISLATRSILKK